MPAAIRTFSGIAEAADEIRRHFLRGEETLPEHVVAKVAPHVGTGASPVDLVVTFAESVYANADDMTAETKELAGGAAAFAEAFGFHGMNVEARGSRIAQALAGEALDEPPEPKAEFGPPPAEPETPEA